MRRPLFGTGIPKSMRTTDGAITVFDANAFTPQAGAPQAFAVTLFAWTWQRTQPDPTPTKLPFPSVAVVTSGVPIIVAQRDPAAVAALQAAEVSSYARPIKLLDRLIVRGDQQIVAGNVNFAGDAAGTRSCFIYGYFEVAGESLPSLPFRPLQPVTPMVAPFNAPVAVVDLSVSAATQYKVAHQLSSAYIDLLLLNTDQGGFSTFEAPIDADCFLKLPGGIKMPLPFSTGHILLNAQPFDFQPLIAPSSSDVDISVGFETSGTLAPGSRVAVSAYGLFTRR